MSTNPFITNPVKCICYDPIKNINRRTFVFLGDVPKNIAHAAENYTGANAREKSQYDHLLREFYGPDYKKKLVLDVKNISSYGVEWKEEESHEGGIDDINADDNINAYGINASNDDIRQNSDADIDYSDIEELLEIKEAKKTDKRATTFSREYTGWTEFEPGVEYVTSVHVYPEDKFSEMKEKVYLTTNIPTYRQHMFYTDRARLYNIFTLFADGIYNVDIRKLISSKENVLGIPIDKYLYDIRTEIKVEALDTFRILFNKITYNYTVYVVDLAQFTHRIQSQILEIINDTYYFELFYYGFVIKYWPQLTKECFYDYIINEPELQHRYPELAKNKQLIETTHRIEKDIIDYNYKNMIKALSWADNVGVTIAITQIVATVNNPGVQLNIRNLFDRLRVTRCIPEIHAYIEYNGKRYLLRKKHIKNASDIQFPAGTLMKTGLTLAISMRKADQDSFHSKKSISTMENEQSRYLFLNLWANGKYYVRTVWNEEDELGFEDIIRIIKRFTDPVINGVNALGRYVFVNGSNISQITKQNINYQGLNICIFWKRVMLESTFKLLKTLWDPYMRAKITGPRNVQQFDKYEFMFRKCMYEFDITAIEKIVTASNNIILNNYYAYLSNNAIKQKWDQNYDGRIVRMSHRTTTVRFEVSDITEQEFVLFFRYIVLFIYRASNDENIKHALTSTKTYANVKKLRKLREQDPELYNLKKYGSRKVYSTLCQNKRQPLIYTQDELKNMPQNEIKNLTTYWNFTLNKPAYYGCPSKKYPHLSFTVDAHPKHYCLPCCSKALTNEESKKTQVTNICLSKHKHPIVETKIKDVSSRHVMNYGKDIDIGRLSKLPSSAIKNLLYNTLSNTNCNYYLYGVAQHIPAINYVGIVYSVAEALDMQMEDLIKKLINDMRKSNNLFNVLINGILVEHFHNMEDLIVSIKELFIDNKLISHEYHKFKHWSELFTELFHILFKVSILTFIDEGGHGEVIDLFIPDILKNEISYVNKISAAESKKSRAMISDSNEPNLISTLMADQIYVLIVKKRNRYYPIFIIDVEDYFKTFNIKQRSYKFNDNVIKLVYSMLAANENRDKMKVDQRVNLSIAREFVMRTNYNIVHKYVNKQNLCYALLVNIANEKPEYVYVPVDYSVHIVDSIPVHFESFDRQKITLEYRSVIRFIDELNKFIEDNYKIGHLYTYKKIVITEYISLPIAKFDGPSTPQVIGFNTNDNFIYYFNKYEDLDKTIKTVNIQYDYNEINRLILERAGPVVDKRIQSIGESLYNNYIYQLFVIEFISFLDRERNHELRNAIKKLINDTNFKKDISSFTRDMRNLIKDHPQDAGLLQDQLFRFYHMHFNKAALIEIIDMAIYNFDHITINKFKKMSKDEIKVELKQIAKSFSVQKDFDTTGIIFPNIYLPCGDMLDETGYCEGKKLMINKNIDDLIGLLAADVTNDLKSKYMLSSLFGDTIRNYLLFTKYPTEIVTVYVLSE